MKFPVKMFKYLVQIGKEDKECNWFVIEIGKPDKFFIENYFCLFK